MSDANAVVAIYDNRSQAEEAVKELQRSGVDIKNLSIVGTHYHTEEHVVGFCTARDRMMYWGMLGAFWGGLFGISFGGVLFSTPDINSAWAPGPLSGWIIGAFEGGLVIGGICALGAGLYSVGVPKDHVLLYQADFKADKYLVMTRGTEDEVANTRNLVRTLSPVEAEVRVA